MSAEGPTKAALRDVMVTKSEHLRPPQDRLRPTSKAFENTMRYALYQAALADFPKTGLNPRRVTVPLPGG